MISNHTVVERIKEWMSSQFPGAVVDAVEIGEREVTLFRIHRPEASTCELEVTQEALDHHTADVILGDLESEDVAGRLARDSTLRLQYKSTCEVPHFETRHVACDGKTYRVVRDDKHNVRIYDSHDQLLERLPRQMLVMQASIYRRHEQRWCEEIRSWRGEDQ